MIKQKMLKREVRVQEEIIGVIGKGKEREEGIGIRREMGEIIIEIETDMHIIEGDHLIEIENHHIERKDIQEVHHPLPLQVVPHPLHHRHQIAALLLNLNHHQEVLNQL